MKKLILACGLLAALPSWGITIIADPIMAAGDYSGPNSSLPLNVALVPGSAGSRTYQLIYGGAYDAFSAPGLSVSEVNIAHTWNPAIDGTINTVAMGIDFGSSGPAPFGMNFTFFFTGPGGTQSQTQFGTNGPKTALFTGLNIATPGVYTFGWRVDVPQGVANSVLALDLDNFCVDVNGGTTCSAFSGGGGPATPEPASLASLGGALGLLALVRHRRKRGQAAD